MTVDSLSSMSWGEWAEKVSEAMKEDGYDPPLVGELNSIAFPKVLAYIKDLREIRIAAIGLLTRCREFANDYEYPDGDNFDFWESRLKSAIKNK